MDLNAFFSLYASLIKCFCAELLPVNDCSDLGFRKGGFSQGRIGRFEKPVEIKDGIMPYSVVVDNRFTH